MFNGGQNKVYSLAKLNVPAHMIPKLNLLKMSVPKYPVAISLTCQSSKIQNISRTLYNIYFTVYVPMKYLHNISCKTVKYFLIV